jgi:hypothetical protein
MKIVYPNSKSFNIFLAGSINNGLSVDWQSKFITNLDSQFKNHINDKWLVIFNPRLEDVPSDIESQIRWEQEKLRISDFVVFNFEPEHMSPISLLELGQCLERFRHQDEIKVVVNCAKRYPRYCNVHTTCKLYDCCKFYSDLEMSELAKHVAKFI